MRRVDMNSRNEAHAGIFMCAHLRGWYLPGVLLCRATDADGLGLVKACWEALIQF